MLSQDHVAEGRLLILPALLDCVEHAGELLICRHPLPALGFGERRHLEDPVLAVVDLGRGGENLYLALQPARVADEMGAAPEAQGRLDVAEVARDRLVGQAAVAPPFHEPLLARERQVGDLGLGADAGEVRQHVLESALGPVLVAHLILAPALGVDVMGKVEALDRRDVDDPRILRIIGRRPLRLLDERVLGLL